MTVAIDLHVASVTVRQQTPAVNNDGFGGHDGLVGRLLVCLGQAPNMPACIPFTHSHLSRSSITPNLLRLSNTIHGILPVKFTRLAIFSHNLSPSFLWSTSWPGTLHFMLHTFLHPITDFFRNTCPYHCSLICCSTKIMSSNPSLSLNPLTGILSHIHLTILMSAR